MLFAAFLIRKSHTVQPVTLLVRLHRLVLCYTSTKLSRLTKLSNLTKLTILIKRVWEWVMHFCKSL
jgi:hypothetical protein